MGTYANQVNLRNWWNGEFVGIDNCIAKEILILWENKVRTTGCCCGHNVDRGMINVIPAHKQKMIKLGYRYYYNEFGARCYMPLTKYK